MACRRAAVCESTLLERLSRRGFGLLRQSAGDGIRLRASTGGGSDCDSVGNRRCYQTSTCARRSGAPQRGRGRSSAVSEDLSGGAWGETRYQRPLRNQEQKRGGIPCAVLRSGPETDHRSCPQLLQLLG